MTLANCWRVTFQSFKSNLERYSPIIGECRQLLASNFPEIKVQSGTLLANNWRGSPIIGEYRSGGDLKLYSPSLEFDSPIIGEASNYWRVKFQRTTSHLEFDSPTIGEARQYRILLPFPHSNNFYENTSNRIVYLNAKMLYYGANHNGEIVNLPLYPHNILCNMMWRRSCRTRSCRR